MTSPLRVADGWQRRTMGVYLATMLTVLAIPALIYILASWFPAAVRLWWSLMAEFYGRAWYQIRHGEKDLAQ